MSYYSKVNRVCPPTGIGLLGGDSDYFPVLSYLGPSFHGKPYVVSL